MPFVTAGDPDLAFTAQVLAEMMRRGANLCELGIPYSDPIADGPVIQASYTRALAQHVKLAQIFDTMRERSATTHGAGRQHGQLCHRAAARTGRLRARRQTIRHGRHDRARPASRRIRGTVADLPGRGFQPRATRGPHHAARANSADRRHVDRLPVLRLRHRHHRRANRCRKS